MIGGAPRPTPGRLAAMIGTDVGVHHVRKVALDEVDALMEPTFQDDMAKILQLAI